jgi:hypothetical protein
MENKKYSLNEDNLYKILMAAFWSIASAGVAALIMVVQDIDFAQYAFLAPLINIALYSLKEFIDGDVE